MKTLNSLAIVFCVSLFLLATGTRADEFDKKTIVTFSGPVQVADTQLPAGTYVFKLADTSDHHVVEIFNADETQVIATIMATPGYSRLTPAGKTVVRFAETSDRSEASGTIPGNGIPIKEWFYPGENFGQELPVVPQSQVAALQPEPVAEPATPPAPQAESPRLQRRPQRNRQLQRLKRTGSSRSSSRKPAAAADGTSR